MQQTKTTPTSSTLLTSEGSTGRRDQRQKELRHQQQHQQLLYKFRYHQYPISKVHHQYQSQAPSCEYTYRVDDPSGNRSADGVCAVTSRGGVQEGRTSSSISVHCRTPVHFPDQGNMSVKLKIREVKSPSSNSSATSTGGGCGQGSDGTPTSTCGATGAGANVTSVGGNSRSNFFGNSLRRFKTFSHLKLISLFLFRLVVKFWSVCTTALFIILLIFWFYGGLITLLLVIISLLGLLYHGQDMLVYYPQQPRNARIYVEMPSLLKLPYESSYLQTKDGTSIHVVLIKQPHYNFVNVPTVIFFHGNAGNIGHRLMNAYGLYTSLGCNVLMVEYRGYGKSHGAPSEVGLYQDAEAAMDYLLCQTQISRDKIIVFGRSLGGAIAIYLASHPYYTQHIHSVFIENTFTSLPEIGAIVIGIPIIGLLPYWCFKNQFPSIKRVPKITVPVMYLSGLTDNLIPPQMMKTLFEATQNPPMKRMALFDNGTHNETWLCPGYYECILNFITEVSKWRSTSALTNYSDVLTKIV